MRIGSLFSGAAGLDGAVQAVFGGEVTWHSEVDPAASKVLAHRFPDVPNLGDITRVDWAAVEPVDVLCGGFPCTDVSAAGKRAGLHNTRSGLWSYMRDAIDALRPTYVVIENVRGLLNANANRPMESDPDALGDGDAQPVLRAIGAVLGDLADIGAYDARWATVSAASVGAPHRRERVFIVATDASGQRHGRRQDSRMVGRLDRESESESEARQRERARQLACDRGAAVSGDGPVELLPTPGADDGRRGVKNSEQRAAQRVRGYGPDLPDAVDALLSTPQSRDYKGVPSDGFNTANLCRDVADTTQWGKYASAIRRWEFLTRPAPSPTEPNRNGNPRLAPAFSEWMLGWPEGWVTQVPGISRNDQLRIVGNGVCPAQAAAALRYLLSVAEVAA